MEIENYLVGKSKLLEKPRNAIEAIRRNILIIVLGAMFGSLMFISKLVMEFLPNIHLLAMFIVVFTLVYRQYALIPIYVFAMLTGFYGGFGLWWVPYLYIWTILWAIVMILPKRMKPKFAIPMYIAVAALHGLLYGTMYAPFQALAFGLNFESTIAWIVAGLSFDIMHMIGNIVTGCLIYPLYKLLLKLDAKL